MRAVIDEVVPEVREGQLYVVSGVVLLNESITEDAVRATVARPGRTRPFHWATEGPKARLAMMDLLIETDALAEVCVCGPIGRRSQERARAIALGEIVERLVVVEEVTELMIETRSAKQDSRDRAVILDVLHKVARSDLVKYGWADKSESALWVADAVCGAVASFLTGADESWLTRLQDGHVVSQELTYLAAPPPKLRKSRFPS